LGGLYAPQALELADVILAKAIRAEIGEAKAALVAAERAK
jgi:hypothetical protein